MVISKFLRIKSCRCLQDHVYNRYGLFVLESEAKQAEREISFRQYKDMMESNAVLKCGVTTNQKGFGTYDRDGRTR